MSPKKENDKHDSWWYAYVCNKLLFSSHSLFVRYSIASLNCACAKAQAAIGSPLLFQRSIGTPELQRPRPHLNSRVCWYCRVPPFVAGTAATQPWSHRWLPVTYSGWPYSPRYTLSTASRMCVEREWVRTPNPDRGTRTRIKNEW